MKHLKTLGLLAVAAAALMAFVGTASATVTSPAGTKFNGTLKASSTNTEFDGSTDVKCANSTIEGTVSGGATSWTITSLNFTNCGVDTVSVLAKGSLSITSTGTIFSTGMEITEQVHRKDPIFGFPITTHCLYRTNNTDIGTLTEGVSPTVIHLSGVIPQVPTDGLCSDLVITGTYTVSNPTGAIIVD